MCIKAAVFVDSSDIRWKAIAWLHLKLQFLFSVNFSRGRCDKRLALC